MRTVYTDNGSVRFDPNNPLGEGGEALVYDLGDGTVAKIFRQPDDPFFNKPGDSPDVTRLNQEGARRRIELHQAKLPDFPTGIPERVVGPSMLLWDKAPSPGARKSARQIIGYQMPMVKGNVMADYAMIDWREAQGLDNNYVRDISLDWLTTLEQCHPNGLVLGDVNNQNQIVTPDGKVFVIDADSAQWGKYYCGTYTERFVDPLICKPDKLVMHKPHTAETDLYAFDCIFWLTTLFVGVWEGNLPLKTKDIRLAGIRPNERALKRISAMHPEVRYPAWATHFGMLPDDMLHHYDLLLHKDQRGVSMRKLLENLRWTNCKTCGQYHARSSCPNCAAPVNPAVVVTKITTNLTIDRVLDLPGAKLLAVVIQDGKLRYLSQKDEVFSREFGPIGLTRAIDRNFDAALSGDRTMLAMNGRTVMFSPGVAPKIVSAEHFRGKTPQFAGNSTHFFHLRGGQLFRESNSTEGDYIDETLSNQTRLWVGEKLGLTFYFVSGLQKAKVFDPNGSGSVAVTNMPQLTGKLLHANVYFSKSRAWLFTTTEEGGKLFNSCFVIKSNGECSSHLKVEQGDPDQAWLSGFIHLGKCAAMLKAKQGQFECLLAATDDGVVGIMDNKGVLVQVLKFDGTAGEVLPTDRLIYEDVLYRIRGGQIHTVKTK